MWQLEVELRDLVATRMPREGRSPAGAPTRAGSGEARPVGRRPAVAVPRKGDDRRGERDNGERCEKNHHQHGRNATLAVGLPRVAGWPCIARILPASRGAEASARSHPLDHNREQTMKTV